MTQISSIIRALSMEGPSTLLTFCLGRCKEVGLKITRL